MGAAPSSFNHRDILGTRRLSETRLQNIILDYLKSDDYFYNPYQHFQEISALGYTSLEQFIASIPQSHLNDEIVYRNAETQLQAQIDMRYVVITQPGKRGVLYEPIVELQNDYIATLLLDNPTIGSNFLQKSFGIILTLLNPFALMRNVGYYIFQWKDSAKKPVLYNVSFREIIPEKDHLKAYLKVSTTSSPSSAIDVFNSAVNPIETVDSTSMINFPTIQKSDASSIQKNTKKRRQKKAKKETGLTKEFQENITRTDEQEIKVGPVGTHKGIEGAHNSCYLDAILFSMFYVTNNFDFLLHGAQTDDKFAKITRKRLSKIVKALRETHFCKYETVWDFREHLSAKNEDLLGAFMDAEQVLYILCDESLRETPFIQYAGVDDEGWSDFMHLMTFDPNDPSKIITVQRNMEASFAFNGDIRMAIVPNPALILGMPRSNRILIHYDAVIPNPIIRIDHLMETAQCQFCDENSTWEILPEESETTIVYFCDNCIVAATDGQTEFQNRKIVNRTNMKLRSIVCIRGAHFTAFVRNDDGNIWYFFDSMAGGYPEVKIVDRLHDWLHTLASDPEQFYSSEMPALVKRSLTDGHLCIYEPILYEHNITQL